MLDSFFITNYFYIRSLRREVDKEQQCLPNSQSEFSEDDESDTETVGHAMFMNGGKRYRFQAIFDFMKAAVLGVLHKDPMTEVKFINWTPIPRKKGLISTAFLLLFATVLLTPEFLQRVFRFSDLKDVMTPDLCKTEDHNKEVMILNMTLDEETNLNLAREQFNYYETLSNSLKKDASLYGTSGFHCPNINDSTTNNKDVSGNKEDWTRNPDEFPMAKDWFHIQ